jgi:hypothetical protein
LRTLVAELAAVEELLRQHQHVQAESRLSDLLNRSTVADLGAQQPDLERVIARFYPKRRRDLTSRLREKLAQHVTVSSGGQQPAASRVNAITPEHLQRECRQLLDDLSTSHIFQWATYYRDTVAHLVDQGRLAFLSAPSSDSPGSVLRAEFSHHSATIFGKGYSYVTRSGLRTDEAVNKSVAGLRSFLDVVVSIYSDSVPRVANRKDALATRRATSAVLAGILLGYGSVFYGDYGGWSVLPSYPRSWLTAIGFLTAADLRLLESHIIQQRDLLLSGVPPTVLPALASIDRLLERGEGDLFCLPRVAEFFPLPPRLEISLQLPHQARGKRFLELLLYLIADTLTATILQDAIGRQPDVISAPLSRALREWAHALDGASTHLIDTSLVASTLGEHQSNTTQRLFAVLQPLVASNVGVAGAATVVHNYPRDFPLDNPGRRQTAYGSFSNYSRAKLASISGAAFAEAAKQPRAAISARRPPARRSSYRQPIQARHSPS